MEPNISGAVPLIKNYNTIIFTLFILGAIFFLVSFFFFIVKAINYIRKRGVAEKDNLALAAIASYLTFFVFLFTLIFSIILRKLISTFESIQLSPPFAFKISTVLTNSPSFLLLEFFCLIVCIASLIIAIINISKKIETEKKIFGILSFLNTLIFLVFAVILAVIFQTWSFLIMMQKMLSPL